MSTYRGDQCHSIINHSQDVRRVFLARRLGTGIVAVIGVAHTDGIIGAQTGRVAARKDSKAMRGERAMHHSHDNDKDDDNAA